MKVRSAVSQDDEQSWAPLRLFLPLAKDGSSTDIIMMYGRLRRDEDVCPRMPEFDNAR